MERAAEMPGMRGACAQRSLPSGMHGRVLRGAAALLLRPAAERTRVRAGIQAVAADARARGAHGGALPALRQHVLCLHVVRCALPYTPALLPGCALAAPGAGALPLKHAAVLLLHAWGRAPARLCFCFLVPARSPWSMPLSCCLGRRSLPGVHQHGALPPCPQLSACCRADAGAGAQVRLVVRGEPPGREARAAPVAAVLRVGLQGQLGGLDRAARHRRPGACLLRITTMWALEGRHGPV